MTTITELARLAEAADPEYFQALEMEYAGVIQRAPAPDPATKRYIAAADRQTILGLVRELTEAEARVAELEKLVYVPGQWRCAKCKFSLQRMTINPTAGKIGVSERDKNEPEKCPNGCGPLWRTTERQAASEAIDSNMQAFVNGLERGAGIADDIVGVVHGHLRTDPREAHSQCAREIASGIRAIKDAIRASDAGREDGK